MMQVLEKVRFKILYTPSKPPPPLHLSSRSRKISMLESLLFPGNSLYASLLAGNANRLGGRML